MHHTHAGNVAHQSVGRYVQRHAVKLLKQLQVQYDGPSTPSRSCLPRLPPREEGNDVIATSAGLLLLVVLLAIILAEKSCAEHDHKQT